MAYEILYADPPWDYNGKTQHTTKTAVASAIDHYKTMTLQELKDLNVKSVVAKDALLFLWTSSPHLVQALELMSAWGFEYKTIAFVWDKVKTNPGHYTLSQCELCLVGKRGRFPSGRGSRKERQFISEMRGAHSAKPAAVRSRIEAMFPTSRRLELFARVKPAGWDVFGNEVGGSISLVPTLSHSVEQSCSPPPTVTASPAVLPD
jgi:N6-adenosine-specific RNA methylase IME4